MPKCFAKCHIALQPRIFLLPLRFTWMQFWVIIKYFSWKFESPMLVRFFWKHSNAPSKSGNTSWFSVSLSMFVASVESLNLNNPKKSKIQNKLFTTTIQPYLEKKLHCIYTHVLLHGKSNSYLYLLTRKLALTHAVLWS